MTTTRRAIQWTVLLLVLAAGAAAAPGDDEDAAARKRQECDRLLAQAQELRGQGKLDEAAAAAEKALSLQREVDGANREEAAQALRLLAAIQEDREDFDAARKFREQVVAVEAKLYGDDDYRTMYARLDLDYTRRLSALDRGQRARLEATWSQSIRAAELSQQGKYREALDQAEQVRDVRKELLGENHFFYFLSLNAVAHSRQELGQYDLAAPLYQQCLDGLKASVGERHPLYAMCLNNQASLDERLGFFARAAERYARGLQTLRDAGRQDTADYAVALDNLAGIALQQGDYDRAESQALQAIGVLKRAAGEKDPRYLVALSNLADLDFKLGKYDQADALLRQAAAGFKGLPDGEHSVDYASCLHNQAWLLYSRRDCAKAVEPLLQALIILKDKEGELHPDFADGLSLLALIYAGVGDYDRAESRAAAALQIMRHIPGVGPVRLAPHLANLAGIDLLAGDYVHAEERLKEALKITEESFGEEHPNCAALRWDLAALDAATKRPAEARAMLGKAMAVDQANLRNVFTFSTESAMCDYLAKIKDGLDALLSLTPPGPDAPGDQVGEALTWALRRKTAVLDAELRRHETEQVFAHDAEFADRLTRLRARRQELVNLAYNPPTGATTDEQSKRRTELRAECLQLESNLTRALSKRRPVIDEGVDADAVRRRLPAEAALVELVRTHPFNFAALGKKGGRPPERYLAFVLTADADAPPRMIDLGPAADIDALTVDLRGKWELSKNDTDMTQVAEKDLEDKLYPASSALYRAVFAPLKPALGKATVVYLAPDGALAHVPFEALMDGPKDRPEGKPRTYLIETFRFVYLSSGRDLLRPPSPPSRGSLIFAGPDYDMKAADRLAEVKKILGQAPEPSRTGGPPRQSTGLRFDALADAAAETDVVRRALADTSYEPITSFKGGEALEEVFKAKTQPPPRLLHVATHGFFYPPPEADPDYGDAPGQWVRLGESAGIRRIKSMAFPLLRSGLVLAGANQVGEGGPEAAVVDDGFLTAAEVGLLDLRGTDLVVLAACESGLGDVKAGEGVYGLRAAFLYAGARMLVTSLFHVPDRETSALMEAFYGGLKAGKGKSESLHAAELELIRLRREKGGAAHPFFWGNFILVGDP